MTLEEMKARKRELGYSNTELASLAGIPLGTVQKIFSGATSSPRHTTLTALEQVLRREEMSRRPQVPGEYTLEDYDALPEEQRVELIDGVFYDMAAPSSLHQAISSHVFAALFQHVQSHQGPCMVYAAPFDVQLDQDNRTMVQPDIAVICRRDLLRKFGCFGAPDLVMEILSPATCEKDLTLKLRKYMQAGVREYWVIAPENRQIIVYQNKNESLSFRYYTFQDSIPVGIWDGECVVDFAAILEQIGFLYDLEE